MGNSMELFLEFQELTERKAVIAADAKKVAARLAALEPQLIDFFTESGLQSIKAGGRNFYLHRSLFAGKNPETEPDVFCDAMREAGLDELVGESVNANRLSAYIRERAADLEEGASPNDIIAALPESLREMVKVAEIYSVRSRKG